MIYVLPTDSYGAQGKLRKRSDLSGSFQGAAGFSDFRTVAHSCGIRPDAWDRLTANDWKNEFALAKCNRTCIMFSISYRTEEWPSG